MFTEAGRPWMKEAIVGPTVCLVSHRLGGISGVSIEAAKWQGAFEALGWSVTRSAGYFFDRRPGDVVAAGLWSDIPGEEPPPVDHVTITRLVGSHDLLVLDNAGSLWTAPQASMAWEKHAVDAGIPTIVRHHDPPWHGVPLRAIPADTIPLHDPRHLHVLINQLSYDEFDRRWPQLAAAGAMRVVHNLVDRATLTGGDRDATRAELGVHPEELLVVHPARAIAARKNVPGAVEFMLQLEAAFGRPVRYWITDGSVITPELIDKYAHVRANHDALQRAPGLIQGQVPRQADLYAACDLVLLPSTWEGWGLPVVEAAAAGKIIVAGPYPVLDEIRALGITVYEPPEVRKVAELLADPAATATVLATNRKAAEEHLNSRDLPGILDEMIVAARALLDA